MVSRYTTDELKAAAQAVPCRYCGLPIVFDEVRNIRGNRVALNLDLSVHVCEYRLAEEAAISAAIEFIRRLNQQLRSAELTLVRKDRRSAA